MNNTPQAKNPETDMESQAKAMISALNALEPNPLLRKAQLFKRLYPVVVELISRGVTQKSILQALAEKNLKLHPAKFKQMMAAEAEKANQVTATADAALGVEDAS